MQLNDVFRDVEKIFVDIIVNELALPVDQVWIQAQNVVIPADTDKLFVIVGMSDAKVINNVNSIEPTVTGMIEKQQVIQRENIQIDFLSRDNKARQRRGELIMALQSLFSKQQQETYGFKIFRIPSSFVNSSEAEGTSQINRFSIVVPCHVWYSKEKVVSSTDYYDDFDTRVDDENTIGQPEGLIEFKIKETV